uniref:Uncharacterized protein n=1 Tax=Romanomermis culicivorax TaxID=13658 RepID=A0A915IT38_ROMCU
MINKNNKKTSKRPKNENLRRRKLLIYKKMTSYF